MGENFTAFLLGQAVRRSMGAAEQWETLFEGTVETAFGIYEGAVANFDTPNINFSASKKYTLRATVDGGSVVVRDMTYYGGIGNAFLGNMLENDMTIYEDNGGNFWFAFAYNVVTFNNRASLYTREAGTHTVKIERLVTA